MGADPFSAIAGGIGSLGQLGLGIYGAIQQASALDWQHSALAGVLNSLNQLQSNATGNIDQYGAALNPFMLSTMQGQITNGGAYQQNAQNNLQSLLNSISNGAFSNTTDLSRVPGLQDVMNAVGGTYGAAGQGAGVVGGLLGNAQSNPNLLSALSTAQGLLGNGGGQMTLANIANEMLANRGMSQPVGLTQQATAPLLSTQGYNPALNYATQYGEALTQPNQYVQQAQSRAGDIIGSNPLLSMPQVVSIARDQNATNAFQQLQSMKRQLANTTGVTGPAIAGGGENELLSQFGDQALQAQAAAQDNAMLGQQQLQLTQFGNGINLFNSGVQGGLGYAGQGLNALLQAAGQATGALGTAGSLVLGSGAQQNQNLMTGAGLQGQSNQTNLQAIQALLQGVTTGQGLTSANAQALAQLLQVANQSTGQQSQNVFGLQNFGQTAAESNVAALLNSINSQGGLANAQIGQGFQASQIPSQQLGAWMNLLGQSYQNQTGLFGGNVAGAGSAWQSIPGFGSGSQAGGLGSIPWGSLFGGPNYNQGAPPSQIPYGTYTGPPLP